MPEVQSHQRSIARVVHVDGTGSCRVHVAEEALNFPEGNPSSFVRHLKIKVLVLVIMYTEVQGFVTPSLTDLNFFCL